MDRRMHDIDVRMGSACTINGINTFSEYSADLASFNAMSGSVTQSSRRRLGKSGFLVLQSEFDVGELDVTFYVMGRTQDNCDLNCSRLVAAARECILKVEDSEFEYVCVLIGKVISQSGINCWNVVQLTFAAIKRYPLVTVDIVEANQFVNNIGTIASGVRYLVTAGGSVKSNYKIMDVTIKSVPANKTFIIDGIDGSVTVDGVNKFMDTDLITFPKIQPGHNTIVTSTLSGVTVQAQYYPVLAW